MGQTCFGRWTGTGLQTPAFFFKSDNNAVSVYLLILYCFSLV